MQIWSTHVLAQKNLPQKLEKLEIEIDELTRFIDDFGEFLPDEDVTLYRIKIKKLNNEYEELFSFKEKFEVKYPILMTILDRIIRFDLPESKYFKSAKEYSKYLRKHIKYLKESLSRDEDIEGGTYQGVKNYLHRRRSPTLYDINPEEVFCEIFANYMLYGNRALMHNENYQVLKTILPELK